MRSYPTAERLWEVFDYQPETGLLIWKKSLSNKGWIGATAGASTSDGHIQVGVDGGNFLAHRLIWVMMAGALPPDGVEIDHVDQIGTNNRWDNLRLLTRMSNMENVTKPNSHNNSGYRGVDFHSASGLWRACIKVQRKQKCLGYFRSAKEASEAYTRAKAELHPAWNGVNPDA